MNTTQSPLPQTTQQHQNEPKSSLQEASQIQNEDKSNMSSRDLVVGQNHQLTSTNPHGDGAKELQSASNDVLMAEPTKKVKPDGDTTNMMGGSEPHPGGHNNSPTNDTILSSAFQDEHKKPSGEENIIDEEDKSQSKGNLNSANNNQNVDTPKNPQTSDKTLNLDQDSINNLSLFNQNQLSGLLQKNNSTPKNNNLFQNLLGQQNQSANNSLASQLGLGMGGLQQGLGNQNNILSQYLLLQNNPMLSGLGNMGLLGNLFGNNSQLNSFSSIQNSIQQYQLQALLKNSLLGGNLGNSSLNQNILLALLQPQISQQQQQQQQLLLLQQLLNQQSISQQQQQQQQPTHKVRISSESIPRVRENPYRANPEKMEEQKKEMQKPYNKKKPFTIYEFIHEKSEAKIQEEQEKINDEKSEVKEIAEEEKSSDSKDGESTTQGYKSALRKRTRPSKEDEEKAAKNSKESKAPQNKKIKEKLAGKADKNSEAETKGSSSADQDDKEGNADSTQKSSASKKNKDAEKYPKKSRSQAAYELTPERRPMKRERKPNRLQMIRQLDFENNPDLHESYQRRIISLNPEEKQNDKKKNHDLENDSEVSEEMDTRIGEEYQADIPELESADSTPLRKQKKLKLIWSPAQIERRKFTNFVRKLTKELGHDITNQERLIKLLAKFKYDDQKLYDSCKKNQSYYSTQLRTGSDGRILRQRKDSN